MGKALKSLISFFVIALSAAQAIGAVDMFLKIDGVPGESTNVSHPGWIELDSFQWGVGRGVAHGPACLYTQTLQFVRRGHPSPQLMQLCNQHATIPYLTLEIGGERHMLQNVSFTQCQSQPVGTGNVNETISIKFAKCATHYSPQLPVTYKPQKDDGSTVRTGDLGKNIAIKVKPENPNAIIAILIGSRTQVQATTVSAVNLSGNANAHFRQATIVCRKAGGEQDALGQAFRLKQLLPALTVTLNNGQKWTFSNVTISNVNGDGKTERFSLNFSKVEGPLNGFKDVDYKD